MEYKHILCPCCQKEVDIPLGKYSTGFDFNYSILINSTEEFFDLVDICPDCGYVMLFDNGISEEMKEYVASDKYRNILQNEGLEEGVKKWILYAILTEFDENHTEAGIAYLKAYDYLELKEMAADHRLIKKAAACFLRAVKEYGTFSDAVLAADSMRRDGEMEKARSFLDTVDETFEGELAEELIQKERAWIDLNETEKKYLDI